MRGHIHSDSSYMYAIRICIIACGQKRTTTRHAGKTMKRRVWKTCATTTASWWIRKKNDTAFFKSDRRFTFFQWVGLTLRRRRRQRRSSLLCWHLNAHMFANIGSETGGQTREATNSVDDVIGKSVQLVARFSMLVRSRVCKALLKCRLAGNFSIKKLFAKRHYKNVLLLSGACVAVYTLAKLPRLHTFVFLIAVSITHTKAME